MFWLLPSLVLALVLLSIGVVLLWLRKTHPHSPSELIATVDALLPQTQCAQCGYPGCLPYAEAVVAEQAAINLCAPGGEPVRTALAELFADTSDPTPETTHTSKAFIREGECIGCALCLPACPVDAIVGANGYLHTVVVDRCTGCELCVPACPVDCIEMLGTTEEQTLEAQPLIANPCIRCGFCNPACPVELNVAALYEAVQLDNANLQTSLDLARCIECGLCDQVCPQEIPLQSAFGAAKQDLLDAEQNRRQRDQLKAQFADHEHRLATIEQGKKARRAERLRNKREWQA